MIFQNLIKILVFQILITALANSVVLLPPLKDSARQLSLYLWGGFALAAVNFSLLYWVWAQVFTKKKIAPLVTGVVSKYAILGFVLWVLSPLAMMPAAFFVLGVLLNSVALVLFAVTALKGHKMKTENRNGF